MYDKLKTQMLRFIRSLLRLSLRGFRAVRRRVRSSKVVTNLIMDTDNQKIFSYLNQHEYMLADSVRVDGYAEAIRRHIKAGDVVVDLGTGSGILAILAARQGAKVYAIDHSDFIQIAERVAKHNGVDTITFVQVNSRDFACPEKVDYVLHEQIGTNLFNENMIENLLDLKRRLLKNTGKILPGRFELFLEPVAVKEENRSPFIWEISIQGVDFACLRNLPDLEKYKPAGYLMTSLSTTGFDFFMANPQPVMSFDLNEMTDASSIPTSLKVSREVLRAGRMEGLSMYFSIIFDDELQIDTAPQNKATSWGKLMLRSPHTEYAVGDTISYSVEIGDLTDLKTWTISYDHNSAD
jgi:type I protein arginine methyltransferase